MWKVLIIGTLASALVVACESAATPTVTISTATPFPADTPTATSTATPTPTATPIPTSTPTPTRHDSLNVADESSGGCDEDFVALTGLVQDAIAKSDDTIDELIWVQVEYPPDLWSQMDDAGRELATVWNNIALDSGVQPKQALAHVAAAWRMLAKAPISVSRAQEEGYASVARAYEALADEFDRCEATTEFADFLRDEASLSQIMSDALGGVQ